MVFSTVEYDGQIDFSKAAKAVRAKNEKLIRAYLKKFGSKIAGSVRIDFSNLDSMAEGRLFDEVVCHILWHVKFSRATDILPSLHSAYECAIQLDPDGTYANEHFAMHFSKQIQSITPSDVMSFFEKKNTNVPFLFGFTFFAAQYHSACTSHTKPSLDDELQALFAVLDGNWSIYLLFVALRHVNDRESLHTILKRELLHLGEDEWGMVQALLTPGDNALLSIAEGNYHLSAYRDFLWVLENDAEPDYSDVMRVLEALLYVQQSVTSFFREYQSMLDDFHIIIPMVVFYQRLEEFDCIYASAIRKLIEAKHLPGMPARPFETIKAFCDYFSENERKWLAKWDMTLCSFELQYYADDYSHTGLRMRLIDLLCSVGQEDSYFEEFNLLEKPEFDDDGEQINDVKAHLNVADYIRDEMYDKYAIQQVRSAYRVVYRWLSAYSQATLAEEWEDSPDPARLDPFRLQYFYDEIIGDIVHHSKYNDLEIAAKLTNSVYSALFATPYYLSLPLKFFKAYFSRDHDEAISLYQDVVNSESGYRNSAANNLVLLYIKRQDYVSAQNVINKMDDGESKVARQKQLEVKLKKAAEIQSILAVPESELELCTIGNLHLLYLATAVYMAHANKETIIRLRPNPIVSLLVPYYHTSHTIIRELMTAEVLRFSGNGFADFDPETATQYSLTSLPLIPNIKGYFNIDICLDLLRDEIKKRTFEQSEITECENKLKVAWLLNSFYYNLDKVFDTENVVLTSGDYEDIAPLVERFTPSQLYSIAWSAVNFVSGNMTMYKFGQKTACERLLPRLLKSLREFSHVDFKAKTFGRPKLPTFHLERILFWVDGIAPEDRFS